jgi:5-amino-6-(5-phospho-D-ribitylamino)uracil phosphatase
LKSSRNNRQERPGLGSKLLISDLDGTMLLPDKTIGPRTRQAISRFMAAGGLFTLATGRCAASTIQILGPLTLNAPIVTHNGALTVAQHSGEVLDRVSLTASLATRLYTQALACQITPMAYVMPTEQQTVLYYGGLPVNEPTRQYLAAMARLLPCHIQTEPLFDHGAVLSLIFLDEPQRLEAFFAAECQGRAELSASLGHSAYTPRLAVGEVQAAGADKAQAATKLALRLGLRPRDIIAFGDNMNDLPLLLMAGQSYCPPNSLAEVLAQIPRRIAGPAEEGVAEYLEQLLEVG